jgi:hypothetical protein
MPTTKRHWFWYGLLSVIVFLLASAYWSFCATLRPLSPHEGDGTFKDVSWRFPYDHFGVAVWGYMISFPEFDLGKDYEAEFKVANLPDIGNEVLVFLALNDPGRTIGAFKDALATVWEYEVVDSEGRVAVADKRLLKKFIWSEPSRLGDTYGIYELRCFLPRKGERYTVRVRCRSDPQLRSFKGRVYLECGGSI